LRTGAAIFVLGCVASFWPQVARAGEDDATTQQARALYSEGLKAYTESRYEEARLAFLKVRELKPFEIEVLRDLGSAEVRTGHMVEGAQALADWLRLSKKGTDKERKAVQELLLKAQRDVGAFQIGVDMPDAEVTVDEHLVGRSPLNREVYVAPGWHTVRARNEQAQADETALAKPGVVTVLALSPRRPDLPSAALTGMSKGREQPEVRQASSETTAPVKAPEQPLALREQHAGALFFGGGIALAGVALGPIFLRTANQADKDADTLDHLLRMQSPCVEGCSEPELARDEASQHRTLAYVSFSVAGVAALGSAAYFLWVPEPPQRSRSHRPLVAGALVALAGLTTGILATVAASDDREAAKRDIEAFHQRGLGDAVCLPGTDSVTQCADLMERNRDYEEHRALGIAGFALAGAAALGTAAYLAWPDPSNSVPVRATLRVDEQNRTLVVFGSF